MGKSVAGREVSVWVKTEPRLDGSGYAVTLEVGEDYSRPLDPDSAFQHAQAVILAVQYAEYDAAVYAQMMHVTDGKQELAAQIIGDLRADRPPIPDGPTKPLRFEPIVSALDPGTPRLKVFVHGEEVGTWEAEQAWEHALHVIGAVTAADLDSAYYRTLRAVIGSEEPQARAAVGDLANWRTSIDVSSRPPTGRR